MFLSQEVVVMFAIAIATCDCHCATIVKTNNTANLNLGSSWTSNVAPSSADIAQWDSVVTAANSVSLGAAFRFSHRRWNAATAAACACATSRSGVTCRVDGRV